MHIMLAQLLVRPTIDRLFGSVSSQERRARSRVGVRE